MFLKNAAVVYAPTIYTVRMCHCVEWHFFTDKMPKCFHKNATSISITIIYYI